MMTTAKLTFVCSLILLISACATQPNPDIVKAEILVRSLQNDPIIAEKAPVALREAEESLHALKTLENEGADNATLQRQAYKTQLRTQIAQHKADSAIAKEIITQAQSERKNIQLEARTMEADLRARQAQEAQKKAEQALRESEEARLKAEDLARQLTELQAQATDRGMVLTLGDVLFDYNKADINEGGLRILTKLVEFLEKYPERNVLIEGHTDSTGSDVYNQTLSEKRAEAVKVALNHQGIHPSRINAVGYGKTYPIASNDTELGKQQNRRVEIILSDEHGVIKSR
ncbi:MAG: OmpA family protein [Methylicorpusculum sp.]|uniref:OmpA family protein n=1 Tax=Methylicorpusculum sp. TaxID=2713644 RepID=UPI00271C62FC|nr:OmpA family protein [Methylicorpusculum sp.]MDO8844293.1 OmpA family protein [Methylicorpusculum sp.]MDO8939862.1 OmpA family protein [Methylicorpusculum sp.]MDO9242169.1 OmpA family protein [Methylicorpusculum sp.]MDP2178785.1 OmpA family protein [Methylicorpusculum sp.]MDP2202499.1 OmpA family protein [Methylicorpusculum sp.]